MLVNNAGGQFSAPAEEIAAKGWRAVERVTVDAIWEVTRTVATRAMIPGDGGLIVFVGFSPLRGIPGFAHAAAGRAAVANLAVRARARVEPAPHPERLRGAGDDPHRGARRGTARPRSTAGRARSRSAGSAGPRRSAALIAFLATPAART